MNKEKILIHACCATCAGYVIQKLSMEYTPVIYFSNPNIHPEEEYQKRKDELKQYCERLNIDYNEDMYSPAEWFDLVKGLELEPEKGLRCSKCFQLRLHKAALFALKNHISIFTTTLTISPHKDSNMIVESGIKVADYYNLSFLTQDFKKEDGFKKTMEIAKKENFYRQNYCGCIYSKR